MRRVLFVAPIATPGGGERALVDLASVLPRHGYEPSVALLRRGPLEVWLGEAGVRTHVGDAGRFRQLHKSAYAIARLRRLMRSNRCDAMISNMDKGHVYGGAAARLAGVPEVWWQHGLPSGGRLERTAALVPTTAVVCGSAASVAAQRALTPRRRIVKISPGIDVDAVTSRRGEGVAIRQRLDVRDDMPLIGIVGRLQPWKGQQVFLRAAARVAALRPEVRFAVVGGAILGWEGSYPDELQRLTAELGIADRVIFTGHQPDVYPRMDALDIVVHASWGEPFGLVVPEAMALGKPVIAAADGGPLEVVEDGRSGLLVPPGQPDVLAATIERLLADPRLAGSLGSAAAARAASFSRDRSGAEFAELLDTLV